MTVQDYADSNRNESGSGKQIDTPVTQPRSGPVLYEVVSRNGNISSAKFQSAEAATIYARDCWPDQQQDEDRSGLGWDIQIVGARS